MGIYFRKSKGIRKNKHTLEKTKFGEFSFRSLKVSKYFTMLVFCIVISSRPTSFSIEMAPLNSVI
jgi:hypothetical protein